MKLLCYSRKPEEDAIYSAKLAYSMHLALQEPDGSILALNHNSGILYARATQNPDGTLNAKCMKKPWLFCMRGGSYGVIALRTEPDGRYDDSSKGKLLYFVSSDLIHYRELPMIDTGCGEKPADIMCFYSPNEEKYSLWLRQEDGRCFVVEAESTETFAVSGVRREITSEEFLKRASGERMLSTEYLPEGAALRNILDIPDETAHGLRVRFTTPVNVANEVPESVTAASFDELRAVKAVARYSDGSSVEKRVDWDASDIDFTKPGCYTVRGRVHQDRYEFPVAWHKADPCIGRWKGKYYFISTNDLDHEHTIYMRESDTIAGLVTSQQVKILDAYTYPHLGNLLWAPEFHVIKDRLYVFHAGTPGPFLEEQSHVMALKEGGNPMREADWDMPVRVLKKDGTPLYGSQGITLDMTEFESGGKYYVCWSQRQFSPVDQGAWLYIATVDPDTPWKLTSDPVLLSMPEYGWANNHTFVDEGPFALIRNDKVYLTFSSAAVDSTYVVGLMSADAGADLLDPKNWLKENCPLLSSRSVEGEFGTGHNAYVTDDDGLVWNTYHERPGIDGPRSSGIRRVHFNADGFPVLDMTEEMDLKPELAEVTVKVTVPAGK